MDSTTRLTKEKVIEQFIEAHGDAFDYSKVVYVNTNTPIEVYCKKHDYTFFPTPKNHKNGSKCKHCGRESQISKAKKSKEKFIEDSINVYGDYYDYSKVDYINSKKEVIISCPNHGEFERKPYIFLKGGGCKICSKKKTKSTDKDTFIAKALEIYGDKDDYTYTNIISSQHKIEIRCKIHDITFKKDIGTYILGYGCPKCSMENYSKIRKKSNDDYIKEAKKVHKDACDYTNTIYTDANTKLSVKCNIHNIVFDINPYNHLRGASCKKCFSEKQSKRTKGKEGTCGYTKSGYVKQANGRKAYVYIIRCYNEKEEFLKIGKSFLKIKQRFTSSNMPYKVDCLYKHWGEAGDIYDLEAEIHKHFKEFKYRPDIFFAGYTECFNIELDIELVKHKLCQKE